MYLIYSKIRNLRGFKLHGCNDLLNIVKIKCSKIWPAKFIHLHCMTKVSDTEARFFFNLSLPISNGFVPSKLYD